MDMGKSIGFGVFTARQIRAGEVKPGEKESPSSLLGIEMTGFLKILKVFVIRENIELMLGPLQSVPPFFQGELDSEELTVTNIIVGLCLAKLSVKEGTWMESRWYPLLL